MKAIQEMKLLRGFNDNPMHIEEDDDELSMEMGEQLIEDKPDTLPNEQHADVQSVLDYNLSSSDDERQ